MAIPADIQSGTAERSIIIILYFSHMMIIAIRSDEYRQRLARQSPKGQQGGSPTEKMDCNPGDARLINIRLQQANEFLCEGAVV